MSDNQPEWRERLITQLAENDLNEYNLSPMIGLAKTIPADELRAIWFAVRERKANGRRAG